MVSLDRVVALILVPADRKDQLGDRENEFGNFRLFRYACAGEGQ